MRLTQWLILRNASRRTYIASPSQGDKRGPYSSFFIHHSSFRRFSQIEEVQFFLILIQLHAYRGICPVLCVNPCRLGLIRICAKKMEFTVQLLLHGFHIHIILELKEILADGGIVRYDEIQLLSIRLSISKNITFL